jgi:cytochrome c-type biogenesis protein CcmH
MLFWFLLAAMTGVAIFLALWPLSRRGLIGLSANAADLAVYRDQLIEIKSDRSRGLIAEPEAEAARVEIARRLITASKLEQRAKPGKGSLGRRRAAAIIFLAGIPLISIVLYLSLGHPELPSAIPSRTAVSPSNVDVAALVARVENHLAEKPDDGRGWELLAPVYLRSGRTADAVNARKNALRLLGETAERQTNLGEAIVADANGVVTADALAAFERAVALDGKQSKARFFLGLAAEQDGRRDDAEKIWQALVADAPVDAPWLPAAQMGLDRMKNLKAGRQ